MALTKINYSGQGDILHAKMPSGSVVQTVYSSHSPQYFHNTASMVTTNFSVTITPKFSTSRIVLFQSSNCFFYSSSSAYNTTNFHIYKSVGGATASAVNSNTWYYQVNAGNSNNNRNVSFNYSETPSTTSSIVYTLYIASPNARDTIWNEGTYSIASWIAQEIAV